MISLGGACAYAAGGNVGLQAAGMFRYRLAGN